MVHLTNRVAVYSCITGDYDQIKPHPHIPGVDWIMFTDGGIHENGWDVRSCRFSDTSPRLAAKYHKVFPHRVLDDYDTTIWIDGSVTVTSTSFVEIALADTYPTPIAFFSHPERSCIYDEAVASMDYRKYDQTPILSQIACYRAAGFPRHWGLWAGTVIARHQSGIMKDLMSAWWEEILAWGIQDQISLPPVLRKFDVWPGHIPGDLYSNMLLKVDFAGHKSEY